MSDLYFILIALLYIVLLGYGIKRTWIFSKKILRSILNILKKDDELIGIAIMIFAFVFLIISPINGLRAIVNKMVKNTEYFAIIPVLVLILSRIFTMDFEYSRSIIENGISTELRSIDYIMYEIGFFRMNFSEASAIWLLRTFLQFIIATTFFTLIYFWWKKRNDSKPKILIVDNQMIHITTYVLIGVLCLWPLIIAVLLATKDYSIFSGLVNSESVGLTHFIHAISNIDLLIDSLLLNLIMFMLTFIVSMSVIGAVVRLINKKIKIIIVFTLLFPIILPSSVLASVFGSVDFIGGKAAYLLIYTMKYSAMAISLASMISLFNSTKHNDTKFFPNALIAIYVLTSMLFLFLPIWILSTQQDIPIHWGENIINQILILLFISIIVSIISTFIALVISYSVVAKQKNKWLYITVFLLVLSIGNQGGHQYLYLSNFKVLNTYIPYLVQNLLVVESVFVFSIFCYCKLRNNKVEVINELPFKRYFEMCKSCVLVVFVLNVSRIWNDSYTGSVFISNPDKAHPMNTLYMIMKMGNGDLGIYGVIYSVVPVVILVVIITVLVVKKGVKV